jgi:putative inorganic carbon (HCO3(-)) transporter
MIILFFLILFKMSLFGAKTWINRGFGFASWGISGPPGLFSNSGELSLLMAMLAVMSFVFLLACSKPKRWYYLLPITAVMTVMAASSRGGQLALVVGALFVAIFVTKVNVKSLFGAMFVCLLVAFLLPQEQKDRFSAMGEDGTSTSRLTYWKAGLGMLGKHPLLGVGHHSFPLYFDDNYSHLKKGGYSVGRSEVSHNSFIQVGSTLGYSGLAVYLFMIYFCFRQNRSIRKLCREHSARADVQWCSKWSSGLDAGLITYLVGSFFMSVAFYPYIYLIMMFCQVTKNTLVRQIRESKQMDRYTQDNGLLSQ